MSNKDKAKNESQQMKGKVKEVAGRATGNEALERKGKRDQSRADLKQAGEKIKDAVRG
ncbi:MAG TPA: CsbD family protein [Acidimicrobiales bacterium]|nr:CsbD family protein [Acidimicrobiales bacterium]